MRRSKLLVAALCCGMTLPMPVSGPLTGPASAQIPEWSVTQAIWGAGIQMGAAQMAALNDDRPNLVMALTRLLTAMEGAPGCFDPTPWAAILARVQAGAAPRTVFEDVRRLLEPPNGPVLESVLRCPCVARGPSEPPPRCDQPLSCSFCLGPSIRTRWLGTGGERGALGCPTMSEADAEPASPATTGRYAQFRGGDGAYIVLYGSGERAGRAYVVRGCMFRLYRSRGGTTGALGFPLGDEYAVEGGMRQDFEGGALFWNERTRQCGDVKPAPGASLSGLRWEVPCRASAGSGCNADDPAPVTADMNGEPGVVYRVTLRFRGVVEQKTYDGGSDDGAFWQEGGTPAADPHDIYKLEISAPPQVYYLNRGSSGGDATHPIDYTKTLRIATGARVTLTAAVIDGAQLGNHDASGRAIVVPGVPPAPAPYDGQFIQMDVVDVAPAL
jgi:hypothetical protein